MKHADALATAMRGIKNAKMRSLLTMLGIVIGIASVTLLMSIGSSAQKLILSQVEGAGSNLVFIVPGGSGGSRFASPPSVQGVVIKTLIERDVIDLRREPSIARIAPQVRGQAHITAANRDHVALYEGTSADIFPIRNFTIAQGNAFTERDVQSGNHVAVIGGTLSETLFNTQNSIGKLMRLKGVTFRVMGVLDKKGLGPFGVDQDNMVLIPITVAQRELLGIDYYNFITLQASDNYPIETTTQRIKKILSTNHRIPSEDKEDFTIRTQEDAIGILSSVTSIMTVFLTMIAAISLIVGGIGIMNIMLVSVIERTKEIGLRKALGATNRDILQQFLWESIVLTLTGGLIGIISGALLVSLIYLVLSNVLDTGWTFQLPPAAIVLALGVSSITGLIFGLYPAKKAAKKNPIDALRYE